MCSKTQCRVCKKSTWQGCGMHVSSALAGVSEADRCPNWKQGARYPCSSGANGENKNSNSEAGTVGENSGGWSSMFTFMKK